MSATDDLELPRPAGPLWDLVDRWVLNERDRGHPTGLFGGGDVGQFDGAVYVGRTFAGRTDGGFGNPIALRSGELRGTTLTRYFHWAQGQSVEARALRRRVRSGELTERHLSCWCHPQPCHAWLLCGWANGASDEVAAWITELSATRP